MVAPSRVLEASPHALLGGDDIEVTNEKEWFLEGSTTLTAALLEGEASIQATQVARYASVRKVTIEQDEVVELHKDQAALLIKASITHALSDNAVRKARKNGDPRIAHILDRLRIVDMMIA
jgi:hypothetical protein